jgi:hypothetical protein
MRALDGVELAAVLGGAQGRTWGRVARDYTLACGDGALQAALMTGTPEPYTLGVGCLAGMAGQGLTDGIQAYRDRRAAPAR